MDKATSTDCNIKVTLVVELQVNKQNLQMIGTQLTNLFHTTKKIGLFE